MDSLVRRAFRVAPLVVVGALLSGCVTSPPSPLRPDEISSTSAQDIKRLYAEVEPLDHPLTLDEAIARALKYNLDARVKVMEQAMALNQWDVGRYDLLPKVVADAGYTSRNNYLVTRSTNSITGEPDLAAPYISSDRISMQEDLGFTWSLLDFGQSYYSGKINSDRVLIAQEHRRKAEYQLIADVRTAFWRAASAQRLQATVKAAIREAEFALTLSQKSQTERVASPLDALRYQRQLLENIRLLEQVNQELSSARVDLASLTRLPLSGDFRVAEPSSEINLWWQDVSMDQLESQAIAKNADLRESFYDVRIAQADARRGLLKLFPGLSFSYAVHHSDDSYLINNVWNGAGISLSVDMLQSLMRIPAQKRMGEAGVAAADAQRLATTMSVLAQVHLARLALSDAYRQYTRADQIWNVDQKISTEVDHRSTAQVETPLDRVANETSTILSELRRYQAMALVQAAESRLQATLGADPDIKGASNMSVADLSHQVSLSLERWERGDVFDKLPPGSVVSSASASQGIVLSQSRLLDKTGPAGSAAPTAAAPAAH